MSVSSYVTAIVTSYRTESSTEQRYIAKLLIFNKYNIRGNWRTILVESAYSQAESKQYYMYMAMVGVMVQIHKVYIHSHSMLLLIFTNIFSHIQQPNLHSRNIFIHIYLCISYSRLYLLTFTRCLHSHSTSYIHSHSRSKYSFNIFCASSLRIGQYKTWTAEYGLRTTDWV